jgi:hypothetical protein
MLDIIRLKLLERAAAFQAGFSGNGDKLGLAILANKLWRRLKKESCPCLMNSEGLGTI